MNENEINIKNMSQLIEKELKYPLFVKPSNSGSSVGISKVKNRQELNDAVEKAIKYDYKILIEEGIKGKEIECAVLGNESVIASGVGEIISADEFYSFDAKYINSNSKTLIPARISKKVENDIKSMAIKAFKVLDCKGLSRVDFFVTDSDDIYINEINTMPGFTNISMYPKLWEKSGISYTELIDRLIELAI